MKRILTLLIASARVSAAVCNASVGRVSCIMTNKFFRSLALILAAIALLIAAETLRAETTLHQVRGLAFRADGKGLMAPVRVGIAVYRDGHWNKVPGADYEFMGFSMARDAMYASGHPAPGYPMSNPLGLLKSTDGGSTWRLVALSRESDFHLMAAGYRSNVLYVVNTEPNSRMPERGVYFTQDGGKSWKRSPATGLSAQMGSIAAHPSRPGTVAVGTADGIYVSHDFGANFKRIGPQVAVTAVLFDHDAEHLYIAPAHASVVHRIALDGEGRTELALPKLERDSVTYIAQSPAKWSALAIATQQRHVFVSPDRGRTWKQIARDGEGL